MKKLFAGILMVIMLAVPAFGADFITYSGQSTGDGIITKKSGLLYAVIVNTESTAKGSLAIYDSKAALSGNKIVPNVLFYSAPSTVRNNAFIFPVPVRFNNGVTADVTTSGGSCFYEVYWRND